MRAVDSVTSELALPTGDPPKQVFTDMSLTNQRNKIAATLGLLQPTPRGSATKGFGGFQKIKPWDKRKGTLDTKIRVKLATIDDYDREVVSMPQAAPKVMVRLERVTGTDRVRIKNFKYLEMLSNKIKEEEENSVAQLHQKRVKDELRRYRDLVINGEMEPVEGMEDYSDNPLYRVNRIMKRITNQEFNVSDSLNPTRKVYSIIPSEPFSEYEQNGILFANHPEHYLKANYVKRKQDVGPPRPASATGSAASFSRPASTETVEEEWGGEDYDEEEEPKSPLIPPGSATAFGELLRRNSMTLTRRYLGLDPNDQSFRPQRSRMIEELLNNDTATGQMYEFGVGISDALKRGQAKADDFCTKTHRKLFTN